MSRIINRNTYLLNRKRSSSRRRGGLISALFNRCSLSMLLVGLLLGYLVFPWMMTNWLDESEVAALSGRGKEKGQEQEQKQEHPEWKQQEEIQTTVRGHNSIRQPPPKGSVRVRKDSKGGPTEKKEYNSIPKRQHMDSKELHHETIHDHDEKYYNDDDDNSPDDDLLESSRKEHNQVLQVFKETNTPHETGDKEIISNRHIQSSQSLPTFTTPYIMHTSKLPDSKRMKIMVTGGAGFVGSHLVDKLMMLGHEVIVLDNFFTGQKKNIEHWMSHPNFSLIVHDVTEPITIEVDQIYHLACPASPPHYQYNPVKTIKTSTMGTLNMLGLAKRVKARMLLTSTSEVYGDPLVNPQPETYWGNVNTIGPRSCYDEGKRVAETMMLSYKNQNNVDIRIARIFNTFGPRMHPNDGRVVSNFIIQALQDKPMTVYGSGEQTRSFQYIDDLVDGLYALMNGNYSMPVNLGNPEEFTVVKFAEHIKDIIQSKSEILHLEESQDDPAQRKPSIGVARMELGWEPKVPVEDGLKKAIEYFQRVLDDAGEIIPTGPGASKPKVGVEV